MVQITITIKDENGNVMTRTTDAFKTAEDCYRLVDDFVGEREWMKAGVMWVDG